MTIHPIPPEVTSIGSLVRTFTADQAAIEDILSAGLDPAPLLIWADVLEDRGETSLPLACRWMARHERRPHHRRFSPTGRKVMDRYEWSWYRWGRERSFAPDLPCWLPDPIILAMPRGWSKLMRGHIYYPSWLDAVRELGVALTELREVVRV